MSEVPITGGGTAWHYRNKAQYPVAKLRGRAEAGFFRAGTHQVIPVETCLIQHPAADQAKAAVLAAKDFSNLPIFASMTFGEDGRTFLGTPPGVAAAVLS